MVLIIAMLTVVRGDVAKIPSQEVPERVFDAGSFWYQPLPKDAPIDPKSDAYTADILRQIKKYYGTTTINIKEYCSPVYIVGPEVKTVRVEQWDAQNNGYIDKALIEQWAAVPIPDYALPSAGTDMEMTIYQPSTDTMWEFWKARKIEGKWQAAWGGRMEHVSKSDGIWKHPHGTTATGLPFMGGQITPEELARGEIRHVMGIALVDTETWKIHPWPANRSDGYNPDNVPNRIAEGTRFRLDPSIDVDALPMHPMGKIIAKAAQQYGFVVWDKAGSISLRANNALAYTQIGQPDPYPALFGDTPIYFILKGFPWDKLQFLPPEYGKPQDK
ncbi:MAG: DUF4124 domain-containing protein [Planctomycetes bacterium]|nr:DUF4124 domain-containing protein [Planctomycetota bacterium]